MERKLWTKEELILALNLYLKIPFGKIHSTNPLIIGLANILGRTSSSIALRLTNFAACDPYQKARGIKGMQGGIPICMPIWDEYMENKEEFIYNSEILLAKAENQSIETKYRDILDQNKDNKGIDKERLTKTRINQDVFRTMVLANYDSKCAITGIDIQPLLVASHIIPWSQSEKERLNPENGICLSALYDKAFDSGLISINKKYEILLSTEIRKHIASSYFEKYFGFINGIRLKLPQKYLPNVDFLQYHLDTIFQG